MANNNGKVKVPSTIAGCADRLYAVRELRLRQQKAVDKLAEEESALREHIISTLPKSQASGIAGKVARVQITSKVVPVVEDWDALQKHILKTKQFHLLQRRVAQGAVLELWEDKKQVPGVTKFNHLSVSCTAVGRK